ASWVRGEPGWEVLAPHPLSAVCFRSTSVDNERLMQAVNDTGEIFISHTKIDGVYALRLAIGNLRTQREDVEAAWSVLRREAAKLEHAVV
ncbi:MAG: amino acid decarboxylase, partial [Candidatus Eremiobacteraeota bacterium]|nr:amino acid decarboxylase [Candidatus Eremiobacteraeota bacterium]